MKTLSYTEFCRYSLPEKIDFFDIDISGMVQNVEEKKLFEFLKQIILNVSENTFIRKSAISILVESVFLEKIKVRQALSVLVDEWVDSSNVFIELQRVKDLFYFCNIEPDIIDIYNLYLDNEELEIATEAQLNLGFLNLQNGFKASDIKNRTSFFQTALKYFKDSETSLENRIDAKFYGIVSSVLLDFLSLKTFNIDNQLNELSKILHEKWLNSFDFKENEMDVGFYKTLTAIFKIIKENPSGWTEYPREFNKIYESYSDIENLKIKNRLNKSNLCNLFRTMSKATFIEPYFALNFHSQIIKIDNCIQKYPKHSSLSDFLIYIKKFAEDTDFKKKADFETLKRKFKNCFPSINEAKINKTIKKLTDKSDSIELFNAFEELNSPSIGKFIDVLVAASLRLQANRIFKGDFSEDDRNTYIADLLDSAGYQTKDQTRQGTSFAGKSAGELDILIKDSRDLPFAIIEALNLVSVDKEYIKKHVKKLFNNYDTAGLENNFILIYANATNFESFCTKYIAFISNTHIYTYAFEAIEEIDDYRYTDFKLYKAHHVRQGNKVFLYHLIINLT